MRGTGSHDVLIKDVFVPDAGISLMRPAGQWTPLFHLFGCAIPLPLIYATYVGIAEAARNAGLAVAKKRPCDTSLVPLIGEMENQLALAKIAHRDMVETACTLEPSSDALNRIFTDRTLVGRAVLRVAERAMEVAGGAAFYRVAGLERLFRDIQGVRYHRPQERMQLRYSGELALGWEPES